jgi:pimeloyl-ACP methyl ester carboxylesterase
LNVVLVHGLTGSTSWWRETVTALKPDHEVTVVELPGLPLREAADRLIEWLESAHLGPVALVGHSMGGTVSLLAAAERPDAVARLALVAPAGIFTRRRRRSFVLPVLRSTAVRVPGHLRAMVGDVWRIGVFRLWRVASDLLIYDITPALSQVRAPTLVVWGERDRLLGPELGEAFCEQIPDCRLVVVPRAAHIPMIEAPDAFNAVLIGFLQERPDERG